MPLPTNFSVRWVDKEGTDRKKEYTGLINARKAAEWLRDNGADDVDIAVVLKVAPVAVDVPTPYNEVD
jgi:hypothetical protein